MSDREQQIEAIRDVLGSPGFEFSSSHRKDAERILDALAALPSESGDDGTEFNEEPIFPDPERARRRLSRGSWRRRSPSSSVERHTLEALRQTLRSALKTLVWMEASEEQRNVITYLERAQEMIDQAREEAVPSEALCDAPAVGGLCVMPRGHNMGRVDIPEHHQAMEERLGLVSDALGRETAIGIVRDILDADRTVDNDGRAVSIIIALDHAREER